MVVVRNDVEIGHVVADVPASAILAYSLLNRLLSTSRGVDQVFGGRVKGTEH